MYQSVSCFVAIYAMKNLASVDRLFSYLHERTLGFCLIMDAHFHLPFMWKDNTLNFDFKQLSQVRCFFFTFKNIYTLLLNNACERKL